MKIINYFLLTLGLLIPSSAFNEQQIRENIFTNYNKNNRPILNSSHNIVLKYGLEINNLVYFNQKSENIELTMKNTLSWKDQYLTWDLKDNTSLSKFIQTPKYITATADMVWQPDLELYNAATKPKIFDTNPLIKIYYDGTIEYIRHLSYSFSCKLDLRDFPFDTQTCTMLFGSWKYPKKILDIVLFNSQDNPDNFDNFTVSKDFSHNEWTIETISVTHKDYEYKCCPGDLWPNSEFSITLKRNPHKYTILVIMSIFIAVSSLFINLINILIYYRTFILVFIPLTLIWLQIHTSSKIPVVEYPTKLEEIIISCFLTTMCSLFESGILYSLLTNYYKLFLNLFRFDEENSKKTGYQYCQYSITKDYEIKNNNMNYNKFKKIIYTIDNIYRICLTITFAIVISIIINK